MKTITAADANRGFSKLLRKVSKGEEITILSRGKPVARITSVSSEIVKKNGMKSILLSRLKTQDVTGSRNWTRDELYDSPCV
jgi:prevent-host-death family protein